MTTTLNPARRTHDAVIQQARRAWYLAGVRRRDRRLLTNELRNELASAGDARDVLGDNPADAAREWATERGITDQRARLLVVLPAALIPAVLVSGGVLALLYQAFTANGHTLLNRVSGQTRVEIYLGTGVLSYLAMLVGVAAALGCLRDTTTRSTVRTLAATVPVGAVLATLAGVAAAAAQDFDTQRDAAIVDIVAVVVTLALVLAASRFIALRVAHRRDPRITAT